MATLKKKATKSVEKVKTKKSKPEVKAKKPSAKPAAKPSAKPKLKKAKAKPEVKTKKVKTKAKAESQIKPIKTAFNKTSLAQHIADDTGLERRDVAKVFTSLEKTIAGSISKAGRGEFMMPGMFKIVTKRIPASKGGVKKPNPFKPGEMMITKAKPASIRVKIRPMKRLKDAAA